MYTDEHTYICTYTNIHIRKTYIYIHTYKYIHIYACNIRAKYDKTEHTWKHACTHILNLLRPDHGIIGIHSPPPKILGPP